MGRVPEREETVCLKLAVRPLMCHIVDGASMKQAVAVCSCMYKCVT